MGVCLSTAITDNPNSVLPRNCIFLYFFFTSYLCLKFCKTPFHVVLSKNKTNTKKKYHFSLLISVSFHSSQFFLFCTQVNSSTPKTNGPRVFVLFWVAYTSVFFFQSFFSIFFHYFVTKIYFLHCCLAHEFSTRTVCLLSFLFSFSANSCLVSVAHARARTHST